MSTQTATKLMTAEEFFEFAGRPENEDRYLELVKGEVIEVSRPTRPHGVVCTRVGRILDTYAEQRGSGYAASNDSGVILEREPDTVRGPDVAFYDDAATFDELHPKYGEVPPLLAIEVLSPNDKMGKVMREVKEYLKAGVLLVWVVDFDTRNVTVYRPKQEASLIEDHEEITGEDVLPGFRCLVAEFFRLPGEKRAASPVAEQPVKE